MVRKFFYLAVVTLALGFLASISLRYAFQDLDLTPSQEAELSKHVLARLSDATPSVLELTKLNGPSRAEDHGGSTKGFFTYKVRSKNGSRNIIVWWRRVGGNVFLEKIASSHE